jgi:hypothetical protein
MKEVAMRTVLASAALAVVLPAMAHDGHGPSGLHWHAGDLLALLAMGVAVGLWLWQRGRR